MASGSLTVSWSVSSDPSVTGYFVYWDTVAHDPGAVWTDYANVVDVTGHYSTSTTLNGLTPGTTYYVNVSSHGAGGHDVYESALVGEVSAIAQVRLSLSKGHLSYSGKAPSYTRGASVYLAPTKGSLHLSGKAVTLFRRDTHYAYPAKGSITFSGKLPTLNQGQSAFLHPSKASLTFAGHGASIAIDPVNTTKTGRLTATGYASTLTQGQSHYHDPNQGSLTYTGNTPAYSVSFRLTASKGNLSETGYAPALNITASNYLFPGTGHLTLRGITVSSSYSIHSGHLVYGEYAPTILQTMLVTPGTGGSGSSGNPPTLDIITSPVGNMLVEYQPVSVLLEHLTSNYIVGY